MKQLFDDAIHLIVVNFKNYTMNFFTKSKFYNLLIFLFLISFVYSCDDVYEDIDGTDDLSSSFGEAGGDFVGSVGGGDGSQGLDTIKAGQITAGEWNDLENWDYWKNLFQIEEYSDYQEDWKFDLSERIQVRLLDQSGNPIIDKSVSLIGLQNAVLWIAKSDINGYVDFFPSLTGAVGTENLSLSINGNSYSDLYNYTQGTNEITITQRNANPNEKSIDIAFVVDATGSMGDELEYLKVELVDVIDSIQEVNSNASINMGSVFYRDQGDEYVTRKNDLDFDISKTISFINEQVAAGGNDNPEAVHSALEVAINQLQWRSSVNSRILFLLLDAPPHSDAQIIDQINTLIRNASEKGIKIIPILASGGDKSTEFLMRYFSIATNGTYIFITNHSGIGGEHIEPTIGEYEVEYLNDLLVRVINKYL